MNVPYQQAPPSHQNQFYNQNPNFVPVQQQHNPVQQPQQQSNVPQNPNYINAGQHYPPNYQYTGMMTNLNNTTCQSWNQPNNYARSNFTNHNFSTMCFAPDNYVFAAYMPQCSYDYQNTGQPMSNNYCPQPIQNYDPVQMSMNPQQFAPSTQNYVHQIHSQQQTYCQSNGPISSQLVQPQLPNPQPLIPSTNDSERVTYFPEPKPQFYQRIQHRMKYDPEFDYYMRNTQQSHLDFEAHQKQQSTMKQSNNSQEWTVHDFNCSNDKSTNDQKTIKSPENDESVKPCLAATPSYFETMQCYDNVSRCPMRPSLAIPITEEQAKYFGLPYSIDEHHSLPFDLSRRAAVVQVQIGNWKGEAMIDTGCLRTIISPRLVPKIGGQLEGNYRETATGINGNVYITDRLMTTVKMAGFQKDKHYVYLVKDSPILERFFPAIIGVDLTSQMPPTIMDFQTGYVHFVPELSIDCPRNLSLREILDEPDPVFDPTPTILPKLLERNRRVKKQQWEDRLKQSKALAIQAENRVIEERAKMQHELDLKRKTKFSS